MLVTDTAKLVALSLYWDSDLPCEEGKSGIAKQNDQLGNPGIYIGFAQEHNETLHKDGHNYALRG
jgi:hypothetical protein